jgi:CBS domain-containing protein
MTRNKTKPMESIQVLDPNMTLMRAHFIMSHFGLTNLPVTSDGRVVGVVCRRDIENFVQNYTSGNSGSDLKVANFMRSPTRTVDLDNPLEDVVRRMLAEELSAVAIQADNEIVGALTRDDLLEILLEMLKGENHGLEETLKLTQQAPRALETPKAPER